MASLLVIIAKVLNLEMLMLIAKPVVVPAIYYYYLQTKTKNTSVLFSITIWLFFIADMIMLIYSQSAILWIMACGILSYLILIRFAIRDRVEIKFDVFNMAFLTLLLALLSYILYTILSLRIEDVTNYYFVYLSYGIVLIILVAVSAYNYLSYNTASFLHLCSMALCMLVSDLFYSINRFIIDLPILDHINLFSQFMSYFFMVKYFNSRRTVTQKLK
ncbi:MAG TPA: hypothetical protein VGB50_07145 [Flavobacterium sp.]|jgi:hypothetical protein